MPVRLRDQDPETGSIPGSSTKTAGQSHFSDFHVRTHINITSTLPWMIAVVTLAPNVAVTAAKR